VDTKIGGVPFERHFTCAAADVKIVDLVNAKYAAKEKYVAFEYYPPRTAAGVANLTKRFGEMAKQEPLYADMTWGAGGSTSDLTLDLCKKIQHEFGLPANMHLTCTNMDESKITEALEGAKEFGIRNIVALRGDPPEGEEKWEATEGGFACALDLVVYMRKHYGDYFCISVAGYPEGHPNAITKVEDESKLTESEIGRVVRNDDGVFVCTDADYTKELDYLKQKCDAGADLIITQMFFSVAVFLKFVSDCRAHGIEAPIIPGIMLLQKYGGFKRMTGLCKSHVPANVVADADKVKDDADAFKQYGIDFGAEVCQGLLDAGHYGLHLYTLNVTGVSYAVMDKVGLKKSVE
jgi:methylenetetrahydrofolate reductase (NADPH)